ncbi:hypothetical protein ACLOJK_007886 [Asimina triloba]
MESGRRAETIIVPLELLCHLKPSEFEDTQAYHHCQRRQLKMLEAGILLHPSIPLNRSNPSAARLEEVIRLSELKMLDTTRNSESIKALCSCVATLAWRGTDGALSETCHWADGYPLNLHLYFALLQSVFDLNGGTSVVDEIDELLELMKKTWTTLGITRLMHNVCFAWVLFHQFVKTGLQEQDLLCASLTVLADVANDAKRVDKDSEYVKILLSALASMQGWAEKRLIDYHERFPMGAVGLMENILPLALSAAKIIDENVSNNGRAPSPGATDCSVLDSAGSRVDFYIRSSLRNAFTKILEAAKMNSISDEIGEGSVEALVELAKETEELAMREKENFSSTLKRWHPLAAGAAAVTLHNCYGEVLREYLAGLRSPTFEMLHVLQTAGRLEKALVQRVVEDSIECEDGGKAIVGEMVPYEVDSIIMGLMRTWVNQRLERVKECLHRATETETWNPKSRREPYAESGVELVKMAKETLDDFFEMPLQGSSQRFVRDIAEGLNVLFKGYISIVASCGSTQSYVPTLPPLTRCKQDTRLSKLWKKASAWAFLSMSFQDPPQNIPRHSEQLHPQMSRGTQRLYIRLNTLHHLQSEIESLQKSLSSSPSSTLSPLIARFPSTGQVISTASSEHVRSSMQHAIQHVPKVAAFRLIFYDMNTIFYNRLYIGGVIRARIQPTLCTLEQNLKLLTTLVIEKAQTLAVKEVMRASFDAFLTVLLTGGCNRSFTRSDYEMVEEDFGSLKSLFCTLLEGSLAEEVVEREAEVAQGVIALMGQGTDQLVEDFSIIACEASGLGMGDGSMQKLPMPPTTGRWNRADPNTILRVLCHRNDAVASNFLKKTFQLAGRR